MNDPITRNRLTDAHQYQLLRFLDTPFKKEELVKHTDEDMAQKAMKALSFPVTASNILTARRVLGIEEKKAAKTDCRCAEDLKAQGDLLSTLNDNTNNLARRVQAIESRLGIRPAH